MKLKKSIPERVAAVLDARGGYSMYLPVLFRNLLFNLFLVECWNHSLIYVLIFDLLVYIGLLVYWFMSQIVTLKGWFHMTNSY